MDFRSGDLQLQEASLLSQLYFSPWEKTFALFLKLNFQAKNVSGIFAGNSPAKKMITVYFTITDRPRIRSFLSQLPSRYSCFLAILVALLGNNRYELPFYL